MRCLPTGAGMRVEEAIWIHEQLGRHMPRGGLCVNLGSNDARFSRVTQPYIQEHILRYVEEDLEGRVLHCDARPLDGVDLVGDVTDAAVLGRIFDHAPDVVLVNNLLEHVEAAAMDRLIETLDAVAQPGAVVIVTVPSSYPIHFAPIDTYYRPDPAALADRFQGWTVHAADSVRSTTYADELRALSAAQSARLALRLLMPMVRPRGWLSCVHRFGWLHRPFEVSAGVVQKPA